MERQTARRGAEAPLQFSVACSFLFLGGLFLFLATSLFCFSERPPIGAKSKRIFLSADTAFPVPLYRATVQPIQVLPCGSFIVLYPVARPRPAKSDPLQKNLLAASLSVLFLLCQSRYVLFLLGYCRLLFLLCLRHSRCRANFAKSFENRGLGGTADSSMPLEAIMCFRVTRSARLDTTEGNTV